MSVSGKETAVAGDNALRNCDGEDDRCGNQCKNRSHHGFVGKFTRAKQVLLCSSFPRESNRRPTSSRDEGGAANRRCLFCISRPRTLESPVELQASDRGDPTFAHESVRALLEKNDFYTKECNPHCDGDGLASCKHT